MVENLHPKRWVQNLGRAKSPRPNTICPWAAVNGAALSPCRAKTFLMKNLKSWWNSGYFEWSKSSVALLAQKLQKVREFIYVRKLPCKFPPNGDPRRKTPLKCFALGLFTWVEYQTQFFFTSLYITYACFKHWGKNIWLLLRFSSQG